MKDNREVVELVLRENRRRFICSEYLFAEDCGIRKYSGQKLKVLVLFLSNGRFRSSSNTFNALYDICSSEDVFVDYCYFPYFDDISLFNELDLPYVRGACSGFLIKDFDVVLISVAIFKEVINLISLYTHDGIPLGVQERREKNYPIMVLGGSSSTALSIACGKVSEKDVSLVDLINHGKGENSLKELVTDALGIEDVKSNRDTLYSKLGSHFLNLSELKFNKNESDWITEETSGASVLLDKGDRIGNFNHKILNLDGSFCSRGDLLISSGCNGRGYCSFCLEGTIGGCWKEKDIREIEKDILELKSNTWCESIGIFSYNANYHTNIDGIAKLSQQYFDRSSLLASRADVYSYYPEFLDICKSLGTVKLGIAAEGFSERMRNGFLNKRLSREEFYNAVENILSNQILTLKINYILTGAETEQDFQEWLDDMQYIYDLKQKVKCSTRISLTITNLEIYDITTLRFEKRRMALESYKYAVSSSEFIDTFMKFVSKVTALGIRTTLYGVGGISAFDQILLDLGYNGTQLLIDAVVQDGLRYDRDVTKMQCLKFFKRVRTKYSLETLFAEKSKDYWFPSSLIDSTPKKTTQGVCSDYSDYSCEHCVSPCKNKKMR